MAHFGNELLEELKAFLLKRFRLLSLNQSVHIRTLDTLICEAFKLKVLANFFENFEMFSKFTKLL